MPSNDFYIERFFAIGSKAVVRENRRDVLRRLLSVESQTLTAEQQLQVLQNIGISIEDFGKHGKVELTKGLHDIVFETPFTGAYSLKASGTSATGSHVIVSTKDDSTYLTKATVYVNADCLVRWDAHLLTE